MFSGAKISCGVLQVHGLREDAESILKEVATRFYKKAGPLVKETTASGGTCEYPQGKRSGVVIFSDRIESFWGGNAESSGVLLARKIVELKLGNVVQCGPVPNPTYERIEGEGPLISVWSWAVDHKALRAWFEKQELRVGASKTEKK